MSRKEDDDYKPGFVFVGSSNLSVPLPEKGKRYKVKLSLNSKSSEQYKFEKLVFSFAQDTVFSNPVKTHEPVHQLIQKYLKDYIIDVASIREKGKIPTTDYNTMHVFKSDIISTNAGGSYSSRVNFVVPNESDPMAGWLPKDCPLDVKDESLDVWFIAQARTYSKRQENGDMVETFQLSVYGIHASDEHDIKTEENTPKIESANAKADVVEEHIDDVGTW